MHQGKFITFRSVPHAEFEALRRFGDYVFSPQWNILQRIEPNGHEYRIFDEEHEPFHWGPINKAFMAELHEYSLRRWREQQDANYSDAAPLDISVTPVADERSQPEPSAPT
jgi:hypothetical protein